MHNIPPWYIGLIEFGYIFHSVIDMLFIVVGFAVVILVSRPGWRQHLRWATPAAAASVLTGISRLDLDMHHYLGLGARLSVNLAYDLLNYSANVVSFYSAFMLWRTLRDLIQHPASPNPLAEHPPQPGVWPPVPTFKQ